MMHRRTGWCKASETNETVSADPYATGGGSDFLAEGGSFPISVEAIQNSPLTRRYCPIAKDTR